MGKMNTQAHLHFLKSEKLQTGYVMALVNKQKTKWFK